MRFVGDFRVAQCFAGLQDRVAKFEQTFARLRRFRGADDFGK